MTFDDRDAPPTYHNFQQLLPPFASMIEEITIKLAPIYKDYISTLPPPTTRMKYVNDFFDVVGNGRNAFGEPIPYYYVLREIVSWNFIRNNLNLDNKEFAKKVQESCDEEGYDDDEDEHEVLLETMSMFYDALIDEIMDYMEQVEIGELNKMIESCSKKGV